MKPAGASPEPSPLVTVRPPGPPSFEQARNRRQRVRAAGLHPDHWYPVEWDERVQPGQVIEVSFWKQSIAVFRGRDGTLAAIDNRCAHRQVKLSLGTVEDCTLACAYHGWRYDVSGRCVQIPHDLFGSKMPELRVRSYPVRVRYGLIWIFPGDPNHAEARPLPEIPEIEGPRPWGIIPLDFLWRAHHSMVIDNVSDFTHAWLHRRSRPFYDAKLTRLESQGDRVLLAYDTRVGRGKISGLFVNRRTTNTEAIELAYEYPYQWSNTGDRIKHWCFVLPIDERTTRVFFVFYFSPDAIKIPFLPINFPRPFMRHLVMPIARRLLVGPLISEDGFALEAEQQGYDVHHDAPVAELNPAVLEFQKLTIRKWEEHLAQSRSDQ